MNYAALYTSYNACLYLFSLSIISLGERTFGVLTKLDLMDNGTNALEVRSSSFYVFSSIF